MVLSEEESYYKSKRDLFREKYVKSCEEFIKEQKEIWNKELGYIPFDEYFVYGFKKALENVNKKKYNI